MSRKLPNFLPYYTNNYGLQCYPTVVMHHRFESRRNEIT